MRGWGGPPPPLARPSRPAGPTCGTCWLCSTLRVMSADRTRPSEGSSEISVLLQEDRVFPPPAAFAKKANVRDPEVYEQADRDPEAFWAAFARELEWIRPWDRVLEWEPPRARGV